MWCFYFAWECLGIGVVGGGKGTRTPNPLLAKQVLCQLSYAPTNGCGKDTRLALGVGRHYLFEPTVVGGVGVAGRSRFIWTDSS